MEPIQYFLDTPVTEKVPSVEMFENWPLEQKSFMTDFDMVPKNPHFYQPRRSYQHEVNYDYFVSPRMHIRYVRMWLTGIMYCDCFQVETIFIAKEVGGPWNL